MSLNHGRNSKIHNITFKQVYKSRKITLCLFNVKYVIKYTRMSSDDYQIQDMYKYSRKSYKKNRRVVLDSDISPRDIMNVDTPDGSPRSDRIIDSPIPGCSCDFDPNTDIANLIHKKCPVIILAQQQLQRLLDETDKLLCDNTRCCRSVYDFLLLCKTYLGEDKCRCIVVILVFVSFLTGVLFGAASCGSYLGRFNSPILTCIDNYFMPSTCSSIQDSYRSVV